MHAEFLLPVHTIAQPPTAEKSTAEDAPSPAFSFDSELTLVKMGVRSALERHDSPDERAQSVQTPILLLSVLVRDAEDVTRAVNDTFDAKIWHCTQCGYCLGEVGAPSSEPARENGTT